MSKVLNLHINRKRLTVVLEDRIHIYDVTTMKLLHTIDTLPNTAGISTMSSDSEKSILAYPSNSNTGELTIFDCINLRPLSIIKAHKTTVTKMTFNQKGDLLATASDKVRKVKFQAFITVRGQLFEYSRFRQLRNCINSVVEVFLLIFIIWHLMPNQIFCRLHQILIRFIYSSLQLNQPGKRNKN